MRNRNRDRKLKVALTPAGAVWNVLKALIYVFMLVCALSFIFAFLWIVVNSFKTAPEYMEDVFGLPDIFDGKNYEQVLSNLEYKGYGLFGMLGNSLILVAWNVVVAMTLPHMAAYVLARFDFKFGKILEKIVYVSMVIPVVGTASSTMWFLNSTGLYDNFFGVFILQAAGLGFSQILLTNFYRGVSNAYAEAAYIDGASEWMVFTKIYYPQAKSITMINVVTTVIAVWNDYMTGYLYLPSHPTLALGLQQMQAVFVDYGNDYPVMFAGVVLSMIPILILYFAFSKTIIENLSVGAMK